MVELAESLLEPGAWGVGGIRSPVQHLVWKAGPSPERAKLIVGVAERRSDFPTNMASFDRGELSLEQLAEAVDLIDHFCHIANVPKLRRAM